MFLELVKLNNYRCFDNITISFNQKLTVFIGSNGSGKSSILNALELILEFLAKNVVSFFAANIKPRLCTDISYFSQNDLPFDSKNDCINIKFIINNMEFSVEHRFSEHISIKLSSNNQLSLFNTLSKVFEKIYPYKPVFVKYSSQRFISANNAQLQSQTRKHDLNSIYDNIIDPIINYQSILSWFDAINNEKARKVRGSKNIDFRLSELEPLGQALSQMLLSEYENPKFDLELNEMTLTQKNTGLTIPISQLSQGFQSIFLLAIDLIYRMVLANKDTDFSSDNVLHTPSIVLIDDIDIHLYPYWQQKIIPTLLSVFPNTQFIVTTHSPQVLTTVESGNIIFFENNSPNKISSCTYGTTSQNILRDIFKVDPRPDTKVKELLNDYFKLINNGQAKSEEALQIRAQLNKWISSDEVLLDADMLIKSLEFKC
jgi:predicted ATP-binding protein involved in virulence